MKAAARASNRRRRDDANASKQRPSGRHDWNPDRKWIECWLQADQIRSVSGPILARVQTRSGQDLNNNRSEFGLRRGLNNARTGRAPVVESCKATQSGFAWTAATRSRHPSGFNAQCRDRLGAGQLPGEALARWAVVRPKPRAADEVERPLAGTATP